MLRRINLLVKLQLCNVLQLNEARYGKDPKKKRRAILILCVFIYLLVFVAANFATTAALLARSGQADAIPVTGALSAYAMILMLTIFRAGNILFNLKSFERAMTLPVGVTEIVVSRFFDVYAIGLVVSAVTVLPGAVVYAILVQPAISYYIMMLLGLCLLPLLPITISCILGAIIQAISSRLRNKAFFQILLSLVLTLAAFGISYGMPYMTDESMIGKVVTALFNVKQAVLPISLYADGIAAGDWGAFLLFACMCLGIFFLFVFVIRRWYTGIIFALNASAARGDYVMGEQKQSHPISALLKRELKRYFSSAIYVLNTAIGDFLALAFAIAALIMGVDKIEAMLGIQGIILMAAPYLLSVTSCLSPMSSSAISMEGKTLWILGTLPIRSKQVYNVKLLANIVITLPLVVISQVLLIIALQPDLYSLLKLVFVPWIFILYSSVLGLYVNSKTPVFDWESEMVVVKQSASVGYTLLFIMLSIAAPAILTFVSINSIINSLALPFFCIIWLALAASMYKSLCRKELRDIE